MSYGDSDCTCTTHRHCGCYDNPHVAADAANWGSLTESERRELSGYHADQQAQAKAAAKAEKARLRALNNPPRTLLEDMQETGDAPWIVKAIPIAAILLMFVNKPTVFWLVGPLGFGIFTAAFVVMAVLFIHPWKHQPARRAQEAMIKAPAPTAITRQSSAPVATQLPVWRDKAPVIAFPDRPRRPRHQADESKPEVA
jgi:hypothetical protein